MASFVLALSAFLLAVSQPAQAEWDVDCAPPIQTFGAGNMPTDLNLGSADRVLFTDGTFTGSVNSNGGTICVGVSAAFNPSTINGASRLFVRGTALMPPLAAGAGALLDNEGTVVFQGAGWSSPGTCVTTGSVSRRRSRYPAPAR